MGERVRRTAGTFAASLLAGVVSLVAAAPALADGEPPVPLSSSTVSLVVIGIVVAAIVVVAFIALYHLAATRRSSRRRRASRDGDAR